MKIYKRKLKDRGVNMYEFVWDVKNKPSTIEIKSEKELIAALFCSIDLWIMSLLSGIPSPRGLTSRHQCPAYP